MKTKNIKKIIPLIVIILLISINTYASVPVWQWQDVQINQVEFLQGTGPFVDAFNFTFTIISMCGLIACVIKSVLKVITRS